MVDFLLRLLVEAVIRENWPPRWQKFGDWWRERTPIEKFRIVLSWFFWSGTAVGAVLLLLFGLLSLLSLKSWS